MAENENITTEVPVGTDAAPMAGMLAQYVKDLSFENPNAAMALQAVAQQQPKIDVQVNVNGQRLGDEVFEVALKFSVTAKLEQGNAFVCELVYAGLFGLRNIPEAQLEAFMLVAAPQLLFPFARRVIADATRDGGYTPLLLEPINFAGLYEQQLAQRAQGDAPVGADAASEGASVN